MFEMTYVTLVAALIAGSSEPSHDDAVAKIVTTFLDSVLKIDRFNGSYHMKYHVTLEYPDVTPSAYATAAEYEHWVAPPNYRTEATIGPYQPGNQPPTKFEASWNGTAEISAVYAPDHDQAGAKISRGEESEGFARLNRFLSSLGVPCTTVEHDEATSGSYFLRGAVTTKNGYRVASEHETVNGIPCLRITKGDDDTLWFSVEEPAILIMRDTWRNVGSPRREVVVCSEYQGSGLPRQIVCTHYFPVNAIGNESKIQGRETMRLNDLEFAVDHNAESFKISIGPGTPVLDLDTLTTFRTGNANDPPFSKFLRTNDTINIKPPGRSEVIWWMLMANIAVVAAILLVWSTKRLRQSRK